MTIVDPRFSAAMARLMRERGTTGRILAKAAAVSPSYVSEVLNGRKMPALRTANALDKALDAGGELVDLIALGVGDDDHDRMAAVVINPQRVDAATIATFDQLLVMNRTLDDQLGSQAMLGPAAAQMSTIIGMVRTVVGPQRKQLMRMAGDHAQFSGWVHTSTGQWEQAKMWFGRSMEWAAEARDHDVHATALSYLGHVAWLMLEPANTVSKAMAALDDERVYPGQRAYDAFQAARGYAACGHPGDAERMLGVADGLAEESNQYRGPVPPCQYYRAPWFWDLERGLARLYLAHAKAKASVYGAAVADLRAGLDRMPDAMRGADWAAEYMVHMASGLMRIGELDEASAVLGRAGLIAEQTHSKRIAQFVKGRERRLLGLRNY